jgi:septal ring factor EnvC (AmiA/AmiB activator)
MARFAPILFVAPLLLAASAPVVPAGEMLDAALGRARTEQASAEAEARRLDEIAGKAQGEAARLQAQEAAAAQGIEAAEARITAADAELRLVAASLALRRQQLEREQQPAASLLAGLVMMARRPPLLAVAEHGSTDDFVRVRVLLDSTLPVIRRRTSALAAQLGESERLEKAAVGARQELVQSRQNLLAKRQQFASLEAAALKSAASVGAQALNAGDVALTAGESVEQLTGAEGRNRSAQALASALASEDPAPGRPVAPEAGAAPAPFAYQLPAVAPATDGLGSVNTSGVRSRGLTLATGRGSPVTVPASGVIKFAGPFRSHDGVVIIDHGGGWLSLLVNVVTELKPGQRVQLGDPLGRATGSLVVELSQNGKFASPALIAGSSRTLSNSGKGR